MSFEKNHSLDDILTKINGLLAPAEEKERNKVSKPENPNLLLLGSSRCGSTMFTQWAASLGIFSYPSNFLSRFYKAPYIGALIYNMVTKPEFQYRDEFCDINNELMFASSIGKTKGFKAPHEFWYFWREFMDFPDVPFTEEEFAQRFDFQRFQKELALIQKAFGKPFLCKAKIANWYLKSMGNYIDNVLYLHMHREPVAIIRSLLKAREKWTGSQENWFAWKPREYPELIQMDKYHQVAGQIYFIEKEILSKKHHLGDAYMSFSYEELCNDPDSVYVRIVNKVKEYSPSFEAPDYPGEDRFQISNPVSEEDRYIEEAFGFFVKKYGELKYC